MNKKRIIDILIVVLIAIAGGAFSLYYSKEPEPLRFDPSQGISIVSPAIPLPRDNFTDHNGETINTASLTGKWSLLFFGFTHCPDICPTTLTTLRGAAQTIPTTEVNYVFVTLDPKRDTPDILKKYIEYFDPNFKAMVGNKESIDRLTETVGVIYDFEGDTNGDEYTVNHYSAVLVIDPQARLRAHILPPHTPNKIVESLTRIRDYYDK